MRIDETECPGGYGNGARIALWVKTDKDYYPTIIEKDGWLNNKFNLQVLSKRNLYE